MNNRNFDLQLFGGPPPSLAELIPTIWTKELLSNLKRELVFADVCNRDYEGDIKGYGDTVKIGNISPVVVDNYEGTVNYEGLDANITSLVINQKKYFAFSSDDIDKMQVKPSYMVEAMTDAAHGLKSAADEYISGLYDDAKNSIGTLGDPKEVSELNAYRLLTDVGQALDEEDVPRDGRFFIATPWFHNKLVNGKVLAVGNNLDVYNNGKVGVAAGFDIRISNNVHYSSGDGVHVMLAGTKKAISFASQLLNFETIRLQTTFGDGVRGLFVYGAKVVRDNCLVAIFAKPKEEDDEEEIVAP